jgi:hypothetical protein
MSNDEINEIILRTSGVELMVLLEHSILINAPKLTEAIEYHIQLIK